MDLFNRSRNKYSKDACGNSSMTPSEKSDQDQDDYSSRSFSSDQDSDYESEYGKDYFENNGRCNKFQWDGVKRRFPVLEFDTQAFFNEDTNLKKNGQDFGLVCKVSGNAQIMRDILMAHGFYETHRSTRCFNLNWAANHPGPYYIRGMAHFQTINHFPQTKELTRKDKLFKNVIKMQKLHGKEHFDFVPQSFVLPNEYRAFRSYFKQDNGPFILKPVGLSRGRGVSLITKPRQALKKTETGKRNVVCKYIPNPLILNGYKFDLRIYVAVTSFDPLLIYVYKEGLTRFATVKYDMDSGTYENLCMHLTNYSINMTNSDYIKNVDPAIENVGNKWSLGALLRHLRSIGKDSTAIMVEIEDVIIKTILSVEWRVGLACKRYVRQDSNCFELFGFDILLDENYKAWLIEVNLSPSLGCDTPIDVKIKSNMLCDLLNLVGLRCYSPSNYFCGRKDYGFTDKLIERIQVTVGYYYYSKCRELIHLVFGLHNAKKQFKMLVAEEKERHASERDKQPKVENHKREPATLTLTLSPKEIEMIRQVREEETRSGGWLRVFPTADSWDKYWGFLSFPTRNNLILHQRLFPEMHDVMSAGKSPDAGFTIPNESENQLLFRMTGSRAKENQRISKAYIQTLNRIDLYESSLQILPPPGFGVKDKLDETSSSQDLNEIFVYKSHGGSDADTSDGTNKSAERCAQIRASELQFKALKQYIVIQLHRGCELSEVQARMSFAMYLTHILHRLLASCTEPESQDNASYQQELLDLVLRFLNRSCEQLSEAFTKELPSENVPLSKKVNLMAEHLAGFIKVYSQKTHEMIELERSEPKCKDNQSVTIDSARFIQYVHLANERDLEELLITYAQHNKSVKLFLGGV